MRAKLLLSTLIFWSAHVVRSSYSCPSGWTSLSTGCYQFVQANSYVEAVTNCKNEGGYLVEIDNQEEQNALYQFNKDSKLNNYVWLGGTDVNIEGQWRGSDSGRIIMDFNGWYRSEPSGGFNDNCVYTHPSWGFKWKDVRCSWTSGATALCEYPDQKESSTSSTTGIWDKGITDIYIRNNDKNYKCDLTFEYNVNNETLITKFRSIKSECSDSSPKADTIQSLGKHFFELTSTSGINVKCSVGAAMLNQTLSGPVLKDSFNCLANNDPCSSGWTSLANGCYKFIKADSYEEANDGCRSNGGYLVEIGSQEEQDALAEFHKKSKLRTYVWLGGTDENSEGQFIGNYSGKEILTFDGWYRNEPSGGFNENCIWIHINNGFNKWMDYDCNYKGSQAALCEFAEQNGTQSISSTDLCSAGWTSLDTGCYKFVKAGSYEEAHNNCRDNGGYLVEIDNQKEQDVLTEFHKKSRLRSYVWLGGTDDEIEGQWIGNYSGREIMNFNGWYRNEPSGGFKENCVWIHINNGFNKWMDYDCNYKSDQAALCEFADQNETQIIPNTDSCSAGWTSLDTGCYKFVKASSYVEANNNCRENGGYMVEIDNQEEQDVLKEFHTKSKLRTYVWLGGTDGATEGQWIGNYSGREVMTFDGWYRNEPGGGFKENCVWIHPHQGFNNWMDYDCNYKGDQAALCEFPDQNETQTLPSTGPCAAGWTFLNTGCYKFVQAGSYEEANNNCRENGGYMVEIDSQDEQDVLTEFHKKSKLKTYVWLGGTDGSTEGQWIGNYSGREIMDFDGWYGSEPGGGFKENCVWIHPSHGLNNWMDYNCNYKGDQAALCEFPDQNETQTLPSTGPCAAGWTSLDTGCYKFVQAGSYEEANNNCRQRGGYMVEIESQDELDVLTEFHKKSKLKTYVWLGGTDGATEGQWIGNYSGREIMNFDGWYGSEPGGGFKENCVWTHPSHGLNNWMDYNCNYKGDQAALCELPDQNETQTLPNTGPCATGWTSLGTGCYKFMQAGSYEEANNNCRESGGYLVEINNKEEQDILAKFHEKSNLKTYIWLGGTDDKSEGQWIGNYSGQEIMTFDGWYRNEPSGGFKENCVWIHRNQGFNNWMDYDCNYKGDQAALCEFADKNETQLIPNTGNCSAGWTSLDTGCYRFVEASSYVEANNNCRENGGYLVEINNKNEQDVLAKFHEKTNLKTYVWLGGTDEEREGQWIGNYSGQEIMTFDGWYRNQPSGGFKENCVWIHRNQGFNNWMDYDCNYKGDQAALCEFADPNETQILPSADSCSTSWTSLETGCYKFVKAGSYDEANKNCRDSGGYLVEIDDQEEQDILSEFHKKSKLRTYVWLGGTDSQSEGQWVGNYSGREIMNFDSWYGNKPGGGFKENCVWIHYNQGFKNWMDYDCNYKGDQAALCEFVDQNDTQIVPNTDYCSMGWTSLDTGCYRLVQATSYLEAMRKCKRDGGYLVEIDNQEEQDEVAKIYQKSKLSTYVWLGGTDVEREGQWIGSHSGREIMNFNVWASSEPGGGFDENCVRTHTSSQSAKWRDYRCDYETDMAALCEYTYQNETQTTPSLVLIWEMGKTSISVGYDGQSHECDISFEFNVNNATLVITFRNYKSTCSGSTPKVDDIQSYGTHFFTMTAQSGIALKCSVGVVMVNKDLSGTIIEESLNCVATNDPCTTGWTSFPTGCYKFVKAGSREEAIANCKTEGGLLVEINDQDEQDALAQFIQKSKLRSYVWLGGTDVEIEGQWIGSQSGQIMNFTAWKSGQPSGGFNENCIITYYYTNSLRWQDISCSWKGKAAALCENSERITIQTQSTTLNSPTSNIVTNPTNMPQTTPSPSCPVCSNITTLACPMVTELVCPPITEPPFPTVICPNVTMPSCPTTTEPICPTATETICPTVTEPICPTVTQPGCPICPTVTEATCPPVTNCPTVTRPTCPTVTQHSCPTVICPTAAPSATPVSTEGCHDDGCRNFFNGLGMCLDPSRTDWSSVSEIIDFSAGVKSGKCSRSCNCDCFKHVSCKNPECDAHNGICLIPTEDNDGRRQSFFIPEGYVNSFPCDETINCSCYIKSTQTTLRTHNIKTTPRSSVHSSGSSCKQVRKCTKKGGKCYGKHEQVPAKAKKRGLCQKKTGCKCYKV